MNKKIKSFIVLFSLALFSTGCVKYNVKMDVKKDKSLNYEIIYAMQSSLLEDKNVLEDEDIKKAKDEGYTVKEYNQDGYKGFIISKKIKNIDDVSDTNEVKFSISDNALKKDAKIFTVKKGLFKNSYKAKIDFDMSNSFNMDNEDDDENDKNETNNKNNSSITNDDFNLDNVDDLNLDDVDDISFNDNNNVDVKLLDEKTTNDMDMSQITSSMDLKYTVNLPYKAKSNNATTVKKGGKQLEWNLANAKSIEYEFELYNPIFYIAIGVGIVIVIGVIVIVIKKNKGNKKSITEINNTPTMDNQVVNNTPVTNTIDNQVTSNPVMNNVPTMDNQVINNTPVTNTIDNRVTNNPVMNNVPTMDTQTINNNTNVDNNNLM